MKIYGFLLAFFISILIGVTAPSARALALAGSPRSMDSEAAPGLLARDYLFGDWNGQRPALEEEGLSLELIYTAEWATNYRGGLKKGTAYLGNIDLTATLDTQKAGLWPHGTFFIYFLNNHGATPTQTYIGDLQTASNIETASATRLYQLWYEHVFDLFGDLSVLIGQHDLNSEFDVTQYGGLFLNSSFGIQPSISGNVPVSIFSVAAPAVRLKWEPDESLYFMVAAYDGDPGAPDKNKNGMRWRLSRDEGAMIIYEMGYHRGDIEESRSLAGSYKLGFWYHTDDFADLVDTDTSGNPVLHNGDYGVYAVVDQMLFPAGGDRGLAIFVQASLAPDDRNQVDFYLGAGLHYHGLVPGRGDDTIGVAFAHASISDKQRKSTNIDNHETTVELTYMAQITPWLTIQPDIQIVINPGADPTLDNAVVSLLRLTASF